MLVFYLLLPFFACIGPISASHKKLQYEDDAEWIPEVAEALAEMREQYAAWYSYRGPGKEEQHLTETAPKAAASSQPSSCSYWLEDITHQGVAPYAASSSYSVFRNVMSYGAKGDGVTDDTAAIQSAIAAGGRCAPFTCNSTTTTPALVYFPYGTYIINTSIIDYYYTQMYGNPNCLPTIKAASYFKTQGNAIAGAPKGSVNTTGLIDGDPTYATGAKPAYQFGYQATNVFWRSIRNFIIDTTQLPATNNVLGIHWTTSQATSLQNIIFKMSSASNTRHMGLLIDTGSGGFLGDLVFNGGYIGGAFSNQQFTMRNLTFNNVVTAINQNSAWGWTYSQISINNCSLGLNMIANHKSGGSLSVGDINFIDSSITDTPVFVQAAYTGTSSPGPLVANSLILENIALENVPVAVQNNGQTLLAGSSGSTTITAWGQGHHYNPTGPNNFQGAISGVQRPSNLVTSNGNYYSQSKPTYAGSPVADFISARSQGAKGDGTTDDTAALQKAINLAKSQGKILFVDAGYYLVSKTIYIPSGSNIVGEAFSVIISNGKFFNNIKTPKPVVMMGKPGEKGSIAWSDMIVSTRGQQQGAILFQYNLVAPATSPSGLWDVHARIGGFTGSNLQVANCPASSYPVTTGANGNLTTSCIAAFMTFYVPPAATGLYMENNWLWTADHDVDDPQQRQITIYNGRGFLIKSKSGPLWLVGNAVEHHTLYQYQYLGASNVFAGFTQTETPYYQPNPAAPAPWPKNAAYGDPTFPTAQTITYNGSPVPNSDAWGLRIVSSNDILIYGAGHYSFFNDYSNKCSPTCQSEIVDLEGANSGINIYSLDTFGTVYQVTVNGTHDAVYSDNAGVATDDIVWLNDN